MNTDVQGRYDPCREDPGADDDGAARAGAAGARGERREPTGERFVREWGAVSLIMAGGVVLFALLVIAVGRVGGAAVQRAKARTAADAAALAGGAEGEAKARQLAEANGARLESFAIEGDDVLVEVSIGDVAARARATRGVGAIPMRQLIEGGAGGEQQAN